MPGPRKAGRSKLADERLAERPVRLVMEHPDLHACPRFEVSPGWSIRWWRSGDEDLWMRLQQAAEPRIRIGAEDFERAYGADEAGRSSRICFLLSPPGEVVGTASAWYEGAHPDTATGRVHWVALVPAWQGRGLSKPLLSAVCTRMIEHGHVRARLHTDSGRLPAIGLYVKFGFRPHPGTPPERSAWEQLRIHLKLPRGWETGGASCAPS